MRVRVVSGTYWARDHVTMDTVAEARALRMRQTEANPQRASAEETAMTKGTLGRRRSETPTALIATWMTRKLGKIDITLDKQIARYRSFQVVVEAGRGLPGRA